MAINLYQCILSDAFIPLFHCPAGGYCCTYLLKTHHFKSHFPRLYATSASLLSSLFPRQGISPQIKFSVPILFLVITKCAHKPEAALWSVLLWYITRGWNDQDHRTLLFLLYEASATPLKSQSVSINTSKEKYNSLILFLKSFEV